jgi:uncharacterized protein YjbJ (UPF0337 family)
VVHYLKPETIMDENRVEGTARNVGGKVQEGFGRVTGDAKSQVDGMANQAMGAAQDLYGHHRDPTLHGCRCRLRHRLAARPDASADIS